MTKRIIHETFSQFYIRASRSVRFRYRVACLTLLLFITGMAYERIQTADRIKEMQKQYENSIMAYGYLSNYHTWTGVFRTTGYTLHPTECSKNKTHPFYGITATGTRATPFKTVAVDPAIVKLGSVLIDVVNGGVYLAEDTGNKVKGYTIDIFYGEGNEYNRKKSDEHGNEGVGQGMFLIVEPMKWKGLR